jgi:hypothetical protein
MSDIELSERIVSDTLERRRPGRLVAADSELIPLMRRPTGLVSDDVRLLLEEDNLAADFVAGPPASPEQAEEERGVILKVVLIICAICAFALAV